MESSSVCIPFKKFQNDALRNTITFLASHITGNQNVCELRRREGKFWNASSSFYENRSFCTSSLTESASACALFQQLQKTGFSFRFWSPRASRHGGNLRPRAYGTAAISAPVPAARWGFPPPGLSTRWRLPSTEPLP